MINDSLLSVTGGDLITYLNGSEGTATSINQAWMDYLTREGYTTGTLNDRLYNKLRDYGFTGTLADMLNSWFEEGGDTSVPEYALLTSQYDYAALTSEVTLPHKNILSFNYFSYAGSPAVQYILRGSTGSYLYYRLSDGRFRLATDQGSTYTLNIPLLADGNVHKIALVMESSGMQVYVDDNFFGEATGFNSDDISINQIGESGSVFNFTIGAISSYPMLTNDTNSVNVTDEIGGNNLTYVNLLQLSESSYREVSNDY